MRRVTGLLISALLLPLPAMAAPVLGDITALSLRWETVLPAQGVEGEGTSGLRWTQEAPIIGATNVSASGEVDDLDDEFLWGEGHFLLSSFGIEIPAGSGDPLLESTDLVVDFTVAGSNYLSVRNFFVEGTLLKAGGFGRRDTVSTHGRAYQLDILGWEADGEPITEVSLAAGTGVIQNIVAQFREVPDPAVVPLPGSLWLMATALLGVGGRGLLRGQQRLST